MTVIFAVFSGILGSLIGSFGNVVIWRLPRDESIVFPGSHCPTCNHRLGPLELVPIFSWLALRGKCRHCGARISPRYPLVEALMAAVFVAVALRWPPVTTGLAFLPLWAVLAMLVMAALIDVDHYILPDVLTLPAVALGVLGAFLTGEATDLPVPLAALTGALAGAGVLVLINRVGALVLRRFADTTERLFPISLDQVNIAAVVGALAGVWWGLAAGAVSVIVNLAARRTLRLGEPLMYGLWLVALVLSSTSFTVPTVTAVSGSVLAAGAWALIGATYWWLHDAFRPKAAEEARKKEAEDQHPEPVAMGFGDVKLAAAIGALLGWEKLLVAVLFAVFLGALFGIVGRLAGGKRLIPFGPYLLAGGLAALFFGDAAITWYLGLLGVT
ncbi:MAG: prepilin peptidase [Trueperaceae bacterium]